MSLLGGAVWTAILLFYLVVVVLRRTGRGEAIARRFPARGGARVGPANLGLVFLYTLFLYSWPIVLAVTVIDVAPDEAWSWAAALALLAGAVYVITVLPHWLAWRVLGPLGAVRLGRACLVMAIFSTPGNRLGARALFAARFGRAGDWRPAPASPWTAGALALESEAEGDAERADALQLLLAGMPSRTRAPRRARAVIGEALAWGALRRGDWAGARRRARLGGGRGGFAVQAYAGAHLGVATGAPRLFLGWLSAPRRRAGLPALREALAALAAWRAAPAPLTALGIALTAPAPPEAGRSQASPAREEGAGGPQLAHLHLLARAAAAQPLPASAVEELARAWEEQLTPAVGAALVRRAMELGGQEIADLPAILHGAIRDELELLAEVAEGPWSRAESVALGGLAQQRRSRAFAAIEAEIEAFRAKSDGLPCRPLSTPLEELDRWMLLRQHVERLAQAGGDDALATAFHNGLGVTACNWPVYLEQQRGSGAGWTAYVMHLWSAELASRMGDDELATLSGKNARLVAARLTWVL
ncbi:MAG TPA: hypothetical protein VOA80_01905 [Thermoanaerobaculia bacterium]|nr:hypothetical protein [Thermoanaerobaculia bacterium]